MLSLTLTLSIGLAKESMLATCEDAAKLLVTIDLHYRLKSSNSLLKRRGCDGVDKKGELRKKIARILGRCKSAQLPGFLLNRTTVDEMVAGKLYSDLSNSIDQPKGSLDQKRERFINVFISYVHRIKNVKSIDRICRIYQQTVKGITSTL